MDPKFIEAALTSPMGSPSADDVWANNDGKITAVLFSYRNPFGYVSTETTLRAWDAVRVPAISRKRAGKPIFKRVKHAYPAPPPPANTSDVPQPKRICTTPPILRDSRDHGFCENPVENAGFWDLLSAKVHTRNALYADQVLPVESDTPSALFRPKRYRDPSGYAPTPPSTVLDLAMLSGLQSMAPDHTAILRVTDMTDPVCKTLERGARRRLHLSDITRLSSISERTEPDTPRTVSSPISPAKLTDKSLWTPVKKLSKSLKRGFAKLSPSPNRDRANRIGASPLPSTPSRLLSSPLPAHCPSPKGTSLTSTGSPLRVFTNGEPETINVSNLNTRRRQSLHCQRSRTLVQSRLSLNSQPNTPAFEDENDSKEKATAVDSLLEDSVAQQTQYRDLRSFEVDFGRKIKRRLSEPIRVTSTKELSIDARTNLDIFSQRPVTAVQSLAKAAAGVSTEVTDANVIVARHGGRLVVRFKLPASYADLFTAIDPPATPGFSRSTGGTQTTLKANLSPVVNGADSSRGLDDGDLLISLSSTPVTGLNPALTTPRITLSRPNDADDSVEDASFMSTNTDELIAGLPDTPTVMNLNSNFETPHHAPSQYARSSPFPPPATPQYSERSDMEDASFLSTNTDELVGGLPDTPTAVVLGGDWNTPQNEMHQADSDVYEADDLPLDTPIADQTLAVNVPSSWIADPSSEASEKEDIVNDTTDQALNLAGSLTASSDLPGMDLAENLDPSSTSPLGPDIVQDEPDKVNSIESLSSPTSPGIDQVTGRSTPPVQPISPPSRITEEHHPDADDADHALVNCASPILPAIGGSSEAIHDQAPATNTGASSQACEDHAQANITQITLSAAASSGLASYSPIEDTVDETSTPQPALCVSSHEECDQSSVHTASPEAGSFIASLSEGHAPPVLDKESKSQPATAVVVQEQNVQISDRPVTLESDHSTSPTTNNLAEAIPKPTSLSKTDEESDQNSSNLTSLEATPSPPNFQTHNKDSLHEELAAEERAASQPNTPRARPSSPTNESPMAITDEHSAFQVLSAIPEARDETRREDDVPSPKTSPASQNREAKTPSPTHSQSAPRTMESLLQSSFAPSCTGTPGMTTTPTSRALDLQVIEPTSTGGDPQKQDVPSEPREVLSATPPTASENLAEVQEAENREYLGQFLTQHKASKAARSGGQDTRPALLKSTSTGSPTPRMPLGKIDANTSSPKKVGAKRKADDTDGGEDSEVAKPPSKRGRKPGSALKSTPAPEVEGNLRRSNRVRAKVQETRTTTDGGSKIPVRVGSGVYNGPAAGGETMEVDLATVTRANTRRNKGKALPASEVLARQRQDPAAHRMQELKSVHDARAARAGKEPGKGIQWGENTEMTYDIEDSEDDELVSEEKQKTSAGKKKASGSRAQKKSSEPKASKLTKPSGVKKTPTRPKTGTPVKRQTRSSTRNKESTPGL
ncbi:uncharacterized protein DNG_07952 [Cephalotrichum gorgonifer]|uniref:Uncharacterized protein n=1 Tax=Cephalotrichum gorgonifer TaxID=2041049 RepID=A0AAE8SXX2_9PEZI|nr:uncharacterized protein DNG_07952 [Cephalotrichum gorgonifer]